MESSEDPQTINLEPEIHASNAPGDVSTSEHDEDPSPNHSDQESDEDAASNPSHTDEIVPYDDEEENDGVDELDVRGGHIDAEIEALHHSLREFNHYWKVFTSNK